MRMLRQLSAMLDSLPVWAQFTIGGALVLYSIISIYGRIDVRFGARVFSKIPPNEIRSNQSHVFQYTGFPLAVTIGYLILLWAKYTGATVDVTP